MSSFLVLDMEFQGFKRPPYPIPILNKLFFFSNHIPPSAHENFET